MISDNDAVASAVPTAASSMIVFQQTEITLNSMARRSAPLTRAQRA
jgi:hypothetical protein